jgi:hypothetical protein
MDPKLRLAFNWIWENCDPAGVWDIDAELFRFELGYKLDLQGLLKSCPRVELIAGQALFLRDYIAVNYGTLKVGYNPHKPVFRSLAAHGIPETSSLGQALPNPSPRVEEEDEDKEDFVGSNSEEKERASREAATKAEALAARKAAFIAACRAVTEAEPNRLEEAERKPFLAYWTELSKRGIMRFEAEKFFDHARRMDTWQRNANRNREKFGEPASTPSTGAAKPWIQ